MSWLSLDPITSGYLARKASLYRVNCVAILKTFWMLLPTLGHGFFSGLVNALLDLIYLSGMEEIQLCFS